MAKITTPTALVSAMLTSARGDYRFEPPAVGVLQDRVMVKLSPSAPEIPFANVRVWLLTLAGGRLAWQGWSDAAGYYSATGLEVGAEYIAVGIDPYRDHKATGAGPVVAVAAP